MNELSFLLALCAVAALVGLVMTAGLFVILSLAPQGRFRQLPIFVLFTLLEADWVSLWFISLFFLGGALMSNGAFYSVFAILLFGMSVPITWIVYARIAIARQKIRPVLLSVQKLELS